MLADSPKDASAPHLRKFHFTFNSGCALGVIALGVAIWVLTPFQVEKAVPLFGEPASGLDPHLFPRMVAAVFILLGIWYFIRARALDEENLLRKLDREAIFNTLVSLAAFLLFALFLETLGFVIAGALTMFFLSTFYGNGTYWLGAVVSIAVPFGVYNLFTKVLLVFLPEFPFAELGWL
jgi:putative tricarboxylic transport membrane protein